jgi:hypothetical protein
MRTMIAALLVVALAATAIAGETVKVTLTPKQAVTDGGATRCVFTAELSAGRVLGLDFTASGITSLKDSKGTDLGAKPAGKRPDYKTQPAYAQTMAVSGGRGLQVTVLAPKATAGGSASLTLTGKLKLKVGLDAREGKVSGVALAKGTQFIIGGQEAKVSTVVKTEASTEFTVEFTSAKAGLHVEDMKLLATGGKEIPCTYSADGSGATAGTIFRVRFYNIKTSLDKVDIKYVLLADARKLDLPFSLNIPMKGSRLKAKPLVIDIGGAKTSPTKGTAATTATTGRVSSLKPKGKYGLKVFSTLSVDQMVDVELAKPIKMLSGEKYLVSLVPAARPDSYWGWWKEVKAGETRLVLRAVRSAGSYELRLGRARYPDNTYEVLQRIKVSVK